MTLDLVLLDFAVSIHRLPVSSKGHSFLLQFLSDNISGGGIPFYSLTATAEELSLVLPSAYDDALQQALLSASSSSSLPPSSFSSQMNDDWKAFKVKGPLDFALTGILSALTAPLAANSISVFAISTYDTDYILVKAESVEKTARLWQTELGHNVTI